MRFEEVKPLPQVCQECEEVKEYGVECACYNCDYALERFRMFPDEEPIEEE
jgi:hypothetical protein